MRDCLYWGGHGLEALNDVHSCLLFFFCLVQCCAAKFIEMIDAQSLSLTEEEFNR